MADPMRIRAQASGGNATVRVLMAHEMETGQRKDASGKTIPAWFIQEVTASLNGKPVLTAEWGPAVSKNPFMQFTVKGAKAGDKIAVADKSKELLVIKSALVSNARFQVPVWLEVDIEKQQGSVLALPTRDQIDLDIREQLIVELYSK